MAFGLLLHRPVGIVLVSLALAACSTDELAPSARLDTSTTVSAIQPRGGAATRMAERQTAYPAAQVPGDGYAGSAAATVASDMGAQDTSRLPMIDSEPDGQASQAMTVPAEGVNMDAMLGVEPQQQQRVVGLAEEQNREIAEGNASQPVVAGIGGEALQQIGGQDLAVATGPGDADPGYDPDLPPLTEAKKAAEAARQQQFLEQQQRAMLRRAKAQEETQVAFLPRGSSPLSAPESSAPDVTGRMPADEVSCRQRLKRLKVEFRDVPRISNGPSCGIDYPIELTGLSGGIDVKPAVKLNCDVTEAFAKWVKNELAPSARYRYLSGIKTIKPLGGYSCRTMNSKRGNPMSEHAHGNAIDVGKFVLNSGKEIDVRKPGFFAFREKGLLKAVRSDSCKYFNTVLGPGSDPSHKDHFHFDLRERKSGYRHCSL